MNNVACEVRIHPTKEQEKFLRSNVGVCRFVWNMLVDLQESCYDATGEILGEFDCDKYVTSLRNTRRFLLDTETDAESEWFRQCTAAQAWRRNVRGGHTGGPEALGISPSDEAHSSAQDINSLR